MQSSGTGYREEVLNVALATLLDKRGLVSVPEVIKKTSGGKRLPDVTVVDYQGVRMTIEGRIADTPRVETSLSADAKRRVDEGVSQICIAVIYPVALRVVRPFEELARDMESSTLTLRFFTEGSAGDWVEVSVDGLSDILRRAYDSLIQQDVLEAAVLELDAGIEEACDGLLESPASPEILRDVLELPAAGQVKEEEEDDG